MKPLLQLSAVTKSFGAVRALRGVSFDLVAGEVHALLGENGAGKSTLIKVITGAHPLDDGTIEIAGELVRHLTPTLAHALGIACIYQQPALFPHLTVAENIALRLEPATMIRRVHWTERRTRSAQLLQRIGADIAPDTEVFSLSMPGQQLVEIACALGAGARIVIMDEPTASLTEPEQTRLFSVVRELKACGVGVIYISHRLEEIFTLADRVTVLRDGQSVGTFKVQSPKSKVQSGTGFQPDPVTSADSGQAGSPSCVGRASRLSGPVQRLSSDMISADSGQAGSLSCVDEATLIRMMVGRDVSQSYPRSQTTPGDIVLALRNVGCAATGVRDINLEVRAGEIVGLAGLVGAGRTELARIIFGITPADAGDIRLLDRRTWIRSPREAVAQGIAYVPEDRRRHGVVLEMPAAANITMAIHREFFPRGWLRFRAERELALEYVRALEVKGAGPDAPGSAFSGGNQQKIALARWLAARPKLLILDEPTQGVDVGAKGEIHRIICGLARQGLAILLISSDLAEVLGLSHRVAVMREGTIRSVFPGGSDAHEVMAAALGQNESSK